MALGTQNVIPPSQVIQSRKLGSASGTNGSNFLSYPHNLGVHYILMNFKEYNRYNNQSSTTSTKYSVALPVPDNLKEEHQTGWSESKLGWVGAALEINRDIINGPNNTQESFLKTLPYKEYAEQIARQALRRTEFGEAVEQITGQIVNPHQVTNFTGVILREHQFYWTFTPENQADSNTIRNIFNNIRMAMLPQSQSNSRLLLQYPYEVDISIGGTDDLNRPVFKSCVVVSLSLDGQPEGQSYFRNGGAYTTMKMSMHLKETEAFTRDDIQYLINNSSGSTNGNISSPPSINQSQNGTA